MKSRYSLSGRPPYPPAAATLLTATAVTTVAATSSMYLALAVAGILLVLLLFALPRKLLPGVATAVFALIPVAYLPGSRITTVLSPALLIMLVWLLRLSQSKPTTAARRPVLPAFFVFAWLPVGIFVSINHIVSVAWAINFAIFVLLPCLMAHRADPGTRSALITTCLLLATMLAFLGCLEFALQRNPLTFLNSHYNFHQIWSTYRITTTLGHPLVNGTFFAMTCGLAWGRFLTKGAWYYCGIAALTGVATVATVSRSAVGAAAVAVVVATLVWLYGSPISLGRKLVTVLVLSLSLATVTATGEQLKSRSASSEGAASARLRVQMISVAESLVRETHYLGVGPGASSHTRDRLVFDRRVRFESGLLQLYVDGGIPGALSVLSLLASVGLIALRRHDLPGISMLVAFTTSIAGYEYLEDVAALLLMGLPMLLVLVPDPEAAHALERQERGTSDTCGITAGR